MAKAGKIIAGAALAGITVATGGAAGLAIGFSWSSFAGSLILGGLSYALTPKPKKGNLDANALVNKGQTVAVRQSDLTRQYVYGHTRITRGYAHMESTGVNGSLHQILILCEGPVRSINEVWINDYVIPSDWIDAQGNVTQGRYAGYLTIRKHLGTLDQSWDSLAVSNMPAWTTECRLQGIAYLYVIMNKNQDVFPTGAPNITAIVEGMSVYDPRQESSVWTTNIALHCHDFLKSDLYGYGVFDDDVDEINISAQSNICDEIVTTDFLDTQANAVFPDTGIIQLNGDILQYQFGDQIEVISTGTLPGGLSPSTSYYVIPYQVKATTDYQNVRILLADSFENALLKISVEISDAGSGTLTIRKTGEPRYHGSGIVDSDTPLSDTLNSLVTCMAGRAINTGGFWTLLAGAWRTPDIELTIDDMRSGIGVKNCLSMGESYNVVKGVYISSVTYYQNTDYPAARYQTFIDQDNGLESIKDINLPHINRPTTAQRIAKIELFRGRQDIVFTSEFSTFALQVKPGDNVTLTIDRLGWAQKPFEVTEFSFSSSEEGSLLVSLSLRETAQQIFDWSSGEAIDFDPAPNTNLPNPWLVFAPTGVAYNSRYIDTREGDAVYILSLRWAQHPDAFVREFGDFEIQYKLDTETLWRPSFFVAGNITNSDIVTSSVNTYYDIRIRARNNLGVRSGWVTILGAVVGSSGGVAETRDYEYVDDPVGSGLDFDWGNVLDPVGSGDEEDWGYVV